MLWWPDSFIEWNFTLLARNFILHNPSVAQSNLDNQELNFMTLFRPSVFGLASQRAVRLGVVLGSLMPWVKFGGVVCLCANIFLKSRTPAMTARGWGWSEGEKADWRLLLYSCRRAESQCTRRRATKIGWHWNPAIIKRRMFRSRIIQSKTCFFSFTVNSQEPASVFTWSPLLAVCYCYSTVVFRSQWFSLEFLCHFITTHTVTLSASDPVIGGV